MSGYKLSSINFCDLVTEKLLIKYSMEYTTEHGGILIGQVNSNQILITDFTETTAYDKPSRFGFIRSVRGINKKIKEYYILSNKTKTYLGEWHTHHENVPKPSATDLSTIQQQFHKNTISVPFVLSLIIGYQGYLLMMYDGKSIKQDFLYIIKVRKNNLSTENNSTS